MFADLLTMLGNVSRMRMQSVSAVGCMHVQWLSQAGFGQYFVDSEHAHTSAAH